VVGLPLSRAAGAPEAAGGTRPPAEMAPHSLTGDWMRPVLVACLAVTLVALVYAVVFPNLWYGEHDISDIVIYQGYAQAMASGQQPYRDFEFEYPPIAAWLIALPGHSQSYADYTMWFSLVMFVLSALTAVAVALAATRVWPTGWRPYAAAALFAAAVATVGAIVENRFDIAVALAITLVVLFLARRQVILAAAVIGFGFALKLTPAVFLPLALLLAPTVRRAAAAVGVFMLTALAPFIPYLAMSPGGIWHIFAYHMQRPVQLESVIATPFLLGKVLGFTWVDIVTSYGSQGIVATGTTTAATVSTLLTVAAVVAVYALLLRRRSLLLSSPRALPLAALAVVLSMMAFAKVLSPQFFIWLLPVVALAALEEPLLGALCFVTLLLTQISFPAKYWGLVYLDPSSIKWLAARNVALVVCFLLALWRLIRLPARADEVGGRPAVAWRHAGNTRMLPQDSPRSSEGS
jgi:Glycosyltransferase family 87